MGPLKGFKIIEMAGIGPGPFCGMILADLGAEIIRVDRASAAGTGSREEPANRGKKSIAVDLKSEDGVEVVLKLVESADAIFEGFRPGVMERLGLGPDVCQKRNEKVVFGRMTGWGQTGPLANAAGHDINYIALSGALAAIGRDDSPPVPPLNLIGDFGGGGMLLALGIVAALLETKNSGKGQVIDAAMTDGSSLLMTMMYSMHQSGFSTSAPQVGAPAPDMTPGASTRPTMDTRRPASSRSTTPANAAARAGVPDRGRRGDRGGAGDGGVGLPMAQGQRHGRRP